MFFLVCFQTCSFEYTTHCGLPTILQVSKGTELLIAARRYSTTKLSCLRSWIELDLNVSLSLLKVKFSSVECDIISGFMLRVKLILLQPQSTLLADPTSRMLLIRHFINISFFCQSLVLEVGYASFWTFPVEHAPRSTW